MGEGSALHVRLSPAVVIENAGEFAWVPPFPLELAGCSPGS